MLPKIKRILIPTLIACLFLISSSRSSVGQASSHTTYLPIISHNLTGWIGPSGGFITAIVVDPSNPRVAYAGTWGSGVYKTLNYGQNWQEASSGLTNRLINSLTIDPIHTATLYAGTYRDQLFKSTDGGNTWVWSGTGMQDQAIVYSMAVNPVYPKYVYAATRGISNNGNPPWNGVVYRSENYGQTWSPVLRNVGGEEAQDWVYSLAISPFQNNKVFAATHEHGPYFSPDNGNLWLPMPDGIKDNSGRAIVISPDSENGTIVYYGVWHDDAVYKSYTGGGDWVLANKGIQYTKVYSMAIDPVHTDSVYLATFTRGVLKTMDGASNWQNSGLQDDLIYSLAIDPEKTTTVYAGTAGDGLQKSSSSGVTWESSDTGINNAMTTSILLSPSDSKRVFTSIYGAGVYQTFNRGLSWQKMNDGLKDKFVHALVQDPDQADVIYALTGSAGLFQNDLNSGLGWVSMGQGLPLTQHPEAVFPAEHPFATREMQDLPAGETPESQTEQSINLSLLAMTFAPTEPQIAYLGTAGAGVYKSVDGGMSWFPSGLNGETIQSLAVDPFDANLVYAATTTPGSLKFSPDGGSIWLDATLPVTFYTLSTTSSLPGILFAGTSSGLYLYQSGAWTQLALEDQTITSILVDPLHPERIFAGTSNNGAFYSADGGISWKVVDQNLAGHTIQTINLDPLYPNITYWGTKTHGIYLLTSTP
jgi:hypothetical protein